jgi:hypothetical protein
MIIATYPSIANDLDELVLVHRRTGYAVGYRRIGSRSRTAFDLRPVESTTAWLHYAEARTCGEVLRPFGGTP